MGGGIAQKSKMAHEKNLEKARKPIGCEQESHFDSVLHGKVMRQVGVEVIGFGALKLTGFLKEKMQENNMAFQSLYTVRTLKEKLCYVALDYKAELSRDTQASVEVNDDLHC